MAARSNSTPLPSDKSPAAVPIEHAFDTVSSDLHRARCMALMAEEAVEDVLFHGYTRKEDPDFYMIDKPTREKISFSVSNVYDRVDAIAKHFTELHERWLHERRSEPSEARADAAWQAADAAAPAVDLNIPVGNISDDALEVDDPLGDLEGAIAILAGFSDAIGGLAMFSNDPEARLRGITSICGAMHDEMEKARQAVRDLYARRSAARRSHAAA